MNQNLKALSSSSYPDARFLLWDHFKAQETVLGRPPFGDVSRHQIEQLLAEAEVEAECLATQLGAVDNLESLISHDFAKPHDVIRILWERRRRSPVWDAIYSEAGSVVPRLVSQLIAEMLMGANPAILAIGGFTHSAARLIRLRGSDTQKSLLLDHLLKRDWDACFCVTEEDAGSDLTEIATIGTQTTTDEFSITGEKKFITAACHGLTSNTVYIVVGRIRRSNGSHGGLSCFLVPRLWPAQNGELYDNSIEFTEIPEKMGFRGCANPTIRFGHLGPTRGWLLGNQSNAALVQLGSLMRGARINTGLFAVGIAERAYRRAVSFASSRRQGREDSDNALETRREMCSLLYHSNIRADLLSIKSRVEGGRGLLALLSWNATQAELKAAGGGESGWDERTARLMAPLLKHNLGEMAQNACQLSIQLHGARGYLKRYEVEQHYRDSRVLSIWEGTTFIQAQTFLSLLRYGRSLRALEPLLDLTQRTAQSAQLSNHLADEGIRLEAALDQLRKTLLVLVAATEEGAFHAKHVFNHVVESCATVLTAQALISQSMSALRILDGRERGCLPERFYLGKVEAAKHYCDNELVTVETNLRRLGSYRRVPNHSTFNF